MLYRVKDRNTGLYLTFDGIEYGFDHTGRLFTSEDYVRAVLRTIKLPFEPRYDLVLIECLVSEIGMKEL